MGEGPQADITCVGEKDGDVDGVEERGEGFLCGFFKFAFHDNDSVVLQLVFVCQVLHGVGVIGDPGQVCGSVFPDNGDIQRLSFVLQDGLFSFLSSLSSGLSADSEHPPVQSMANRMKVNGPRKAFIVYPSSKNLPR